MTFLGKEKIELYGKTIDVDHFKLTSKNMQIPKDKRLDFDIWYDSKNFMILKVSYSRLGYWEYKVKNFALIQPDSSLDPTNQSAQTPSLIDPFQ